MSFEGLIFGISLYFIKFMRLYKQYKFDIRLRTIYARVFRIKVIMYCKVFIFAFLYSIGFIILFLVELSCSLHKTGYGFYFIHLLNLSLEIFFCLFFSILFFPYKPLHLFYLFYPVYYDYDSMIFLAQIEKEINNNVSNLNKDILKEEYQKKQYPLVFVSPFSKNLEKLSDFHIGMIKAPKEKYSNFFQT